MTDTKRPRRRLRRIGLIVIALLILRFGVPFALAAVHYSTTPDFDTFVAATPAGENVWRSRVPEGEEIARTGGVWHSDAFDSVESPGVGRFQMAARRGDTALADVTVDVSFHEREPIGVTVDEHANDARVHTVIVVCFDENNQATVNLFVLSGPGETELVILRGKRYEVDDEVSGTGIGLLAILFGLMHDVSPLPEEGLCYHIRSTVLPAWHRNEDGGSGSAGLSHARFARNASEYTIELTCTLNDRGPWEDEFTYGMTLEDSCAIERSWNGRVW